MKAGMLSFAKKCPNTDRMDTNLDEKFIHPLSLLQW